jgi:azurin
MAAKTCTYTIEGNDQMQYNLKEIKVGSDCTEVKIVLKHTGKLPAAAMGHNWVLTKTSDVDAVAKDGMSAPKTDYVNPNDARVIAHTKIVGGGETTSVTFPTSKLKKGGDYTFFCSFPGHHSVMHGKFIY